MLRSKLKNRVNKTKDPEDMARFKKQRNFVVNLNRETKKSFLASTKNSSKCFWKAVKPYFGTRTSNERILLVEDNSIISSEEKLATTFNNFFNSATDSLKIPTIPGLIVTAVDPVSDTIRKFAQHPSILTIRNEGPNDRVLELHKISIDDMTKEIAALNPRKAVSGVIPIKALKAAMFECAEPLTCIFNKHIVELSSFPDELKLAEIIPAHKKKSTTEKSNYRPISLLPVVSKLFEILIVKQIEFHTNSFLSKYLCGFRKGYSCQYSLLNMLRKWEKSLSNSDIVGAVLMDLSKAFDCLPHDLLIAKLHAYGFGRNTLKLFHSYLSKRRHYTRIGSKLSDILEILLGVPQGSVLGPILFNIFINDLLSSCSEDICNFADDNTIHICSNSLEDIILRINSELKNVLGWFVNNGMVANPDKFQVIFLGIGSSIDVEIGSFTIRSSKEVKLLGVTLDYQLSFYPHIQSICGKAISKIKALMRIRNYLSQEQADNLFSSYIMSPLTHCPLIWMFCSKPAHNMLQKTQYKALRARFNDFSSSCEKLLERAESCDIHTRNLRLLMAEIYKTLNRSNAIIMWDSFDLKVPNKYELRRGRNLITPKAGTTKALNSFDFRAAMAWNHLSLSVKSANNITTFMKLLKNENIYCRCLMCRL